MNKGNLYNEVVKILNTNLINIRNLDNLKSFCLRFEEMMDENSAKFYEIEIVDDSHVLISAGGLYSVVWKDFYENGYSELLSYSDSLSLNMAKDDNPDGSPFTISFTLEV